jgi:hypothetical protein
MKFFITAFSLLLLQSALAQQVIDVSKQDVRVGSNLFFVSGGEPFVTAKFVNLVEGTPYFKDEWMKGIVVDKNNHEYKDVSLKIDLLDKRVHFLDVNGKEFIATTPIKEVILTDTSGNNYRFVHSSEFEKPVNAIKDGWYLWLSTGTASLYKVFNKNLSEIKPYGSSTVEQRVSSSEKYLIYYNNAFLEVKKLGDVPNVLSGKKKELTAFLKKQDDQKASMDDRFVKLIEYYNSLLREQK